MADPVFAAQSMGRWFRRIEVVHSASIWCRPGQVTVLLGRNGSGKSTLLKMATGWLRPDYGVVKLGDEAWERPKPAELGRRGVFYLPAEGLLSRAHRVRPQLNQVARSLGIAGERVEAVAAQLHIESALDRAMWTLSGGELRRADVAAALIARPRYLLADEPLGGITPKDREMVGAAIRHLADAGAGVLVTGHDVAPLMDLADNVVWMTGGTTHDLGTPEAARTHDQFRREYLGPSAF